SKPKTLRNKFGFQIYVAPSVSYRKLIEDRSMLTEGSNTGPVGLNYVADVNNVVRHKPGNGIEAGVSILYNLTNKFRFKSGLQFNVRQYSIEAYRSSTELASIALIGDHGIDTINTVAVYRNNNGYSSAELVNRYYQLAIPVGVEWEIIGNKRIQLNVAGSIQPTYLINHNAYILSTNFKNYSENPEMVRSFNINSNIETFISYKVGDFKWQLGPQLRYQPYSTFIRQYPIKEHLMDYGIKIGLSKTFH
ncbi:MAG TPA: outer membrane beta-barrel protein, partial [Segetibacter sp.]|nr:outer membrane beta-barrel protein [Segetibacter sp.]